MKSSCSMPASHIAVRQTSEVMSVRDSKLRVAVIGVGMRGTHLACQIAQSGCGASVVAVAEPNAKRRAAFSKEHGLAVKAQFESWEPLMESSLKLDAVIVATLDNQHTEPAMAALDRGYHLLLEKPVSDTLEGAKRIARKQEETGLVVSVCHSMRFMAGFRDVHHIVADGQLGRLIHVQHLESIEHFRFAHNYVRGRWAKEANNTFLLLHKCCHDVDFVNWLVDDRCTRVVSFGSLTHFTPGNAPLGSAHRCCDCQISDRCSYSAQRLYLDGNLMGALTNDLGTTREQRLKAIDKGPFGACVWQAGNDVVDHQTISMEFAKGATASISFTGYAAVHGRSTSIYGTHGELRFDEAEGEIVVRKFGTTNSEVIEIPRPPTYHPEDKAIVGNWLAAIRDPKNVSVTVDAREALSSYEIVFAAEASRLESKCIKEDGRPLSNPSAQTSRNSR